MFFLLVLWLIFRCNNKLETFSQIYLKTIHIQSLDFKMNVKVWDLKKIDQLVYQQEFHHFSTNQIMLTKPNKVFHLEPKKLKVTLQKFHKYILVFSTFLQRIKVLKGLFICDPTIQYVYTFQVFNLKFAVKLIL